MQLFRLEIGWGPFRQSGIYFVGPRLDYGSQLFEKENLCLQRCNDWNVTTRLPDVYWREQAELATMWDPARLPQWEWLRERVETENHYILSRLKHQPQISVGFLQIEISELIKKHHKQYDTLIISLPYEAMIRSGYTTANGDSLTVDKERMEEFLRGLVHKTVIHNTRYCLTADKFLLKLDFHPRPANPLLYTSWFARVSNAIFVPLQKQ